MEHSDPRYIEYLKTTDKPSWYEYENYCGRLFEKEIYESLLKHAERNEAFFKKINHTETICWLQIYNRRKSKSMLRISVGDSIFNASLRLSGCCNSLMMELSREDLIEKDVELILNKISEYRKYFRYRKILDNLILP